MFKKTHSRQLTALIAILFLSLAPVTFSDDGVSPISLLDSLIESVADALSDIFGQDGDRTANDADGEEDSGLPDYGPFVDPIG